MSAMETIIEVKSAVRPGFFGEHAQELDNVVSRYLPMFYKRAFHFLGNATDAEDAVQDALLSAYKHLGQFRGQAQLSTWLTSIVTNAARMQLRRRRGSYLSLDEQQGEDDLTLSERLPDSKPGPEEVCSAAELHDRLVNLRQTTLASASQSISATTYRRLNHQGSCACFGRPRRDGEIAGRTGVWQACRNDEGNEC
jgi:RNA polymerase sigma factor (sigma-70 family)